MNELLKSVNETELAWGFSETDFENHKNKITENLKGRTNVAIMNFALLLAVVRLQSLDEIPIEENLSDVDYDRFFRLVSEHNETLEKLYPEDEDVLRKILARMNRSLLPVNDDISRLIFYQINRNCSTLWDCPPAGKTEYFRVLVNEVAEYCTMYMMYFFQSRTVDYPGKTQISRLRSTERSLKGVSTLLSVAVYEQFIEMARSLIDDAVIGEMMFDKAMNICRASPSESQFDGQIVPLSMKLYDFFWTERAASEEDFVDQLTNFALLLAENPTERAKICKRDMASFDCE